MEPMLYLIEILHQTTTIWSFSFARHALYLIEILHQTTTLGSTPFKVAMLYLIEILHQTTTSVCFVFGFPWLYLIEILHQTTTAFRDRYSESPLYLIEILHQTTTPPQVLHSKLCCILLKFYIKPQQVAQRTLPPSVVSYWNSTSNHNFPRMTLLSIVLYLIEILHQTTTALRDRYSESRCILLKFYIKPQRFRRRIFCQFVVSYWNSTSNHNVGPHIDW